MINVECDSVLIISTVVHQLFWFSIRVVSIVIETLHHYMKDFRVKFNLGEMLICLTLKQTHLLLQNNDLTPSSTTLSQTNVLDLHRRSSLFKNYWHTKHIAHQPTKQSLKKKKLTQQST